MKHLLRITEIIKVEPFRITVRRTTGEIRVIDFELLFQKWNLTADDIEASLQRYDASKYVSVGEDRTLQWVNVPKEHLFFDDNGATNRSSPLSFDPDVLYAESQPIDAFRLVSVYPGQNAA